MDLSQFLDELMVYAMVFGPPLLAVVFFIVSMIKFLTTDKADAKKRKKWKTLLIASIIAFIPVFGLFALIISMSISIAHM